MDLPSRNVVMQLPVAGEGAVPLDLVLSYSQQEEDGILVCPVLKFTHS